MDVKLCCESQAAAFSLSWQLKTPSVHPGSSGLTRWGAGVSLGCMYVAAGVCVHVCCSAGVNDSDAGPTFSRLSLLAAGGPAVMDWEGTQQEGEGKPAAVVFAQFAFACLSQVMMGATQAMHNADRRLGDP